LIPTVVRCIVHNIPIPIYGAGDNMREWIPVQEHVDFLIRLSEETKRGLYNVTGGHEMSNKALVSTIRHYCRGLGYLSSVELVEDRKGHDFRYAIDTLYTEYKKTLTKQQFNKYLEDTIEFYVKKYESSKT